VDRLPAALAATDSPPFASRCGQAPRKPASPAEPAATEDGFGAGNFSPGISFGQLLIAIGAAPKLIAPGPLVPGTSGDRGRSAELCHRAAQFAADGTESVADVSGQRAHAGHRRQRYDCRYQGILDQILTGFVP